MDDPAAHFRTHPVGQPPKKGAKTLKQWKASVDFLLERTKALEEAIIAGWPQPGAGTSVDRRPNGSAVNAGAARVSPFQVALTKNGAGSTGVFVSAGWLIDRDQSVEVAVSGLRTFTAISGDGYVWLDVEVSGLQGVSAEVVAGASVPDQFEFDGDPSTYDGEGEPPDQTNARIVLAKIQTIDGVPTVRQLVTTHLLLRLTSYEGLPALYPYPGYGPTDPDP